MDEIKHYHLKISTILGLLVIFLLIIADQWTKSIAVQYLDLHHSVTIIESFFDLTLVHNRGAAFGMMSELAEPWRTIFFTLVSIGAFAIIIHVYRSRSPDSYLVPMAVIMITGGAIGNIIDRIRLGYVIDFLDFHYFDKHWPIFNLADSCITIGVTLLIIEMFIQDRRGNASESD